MNIVDEIIKIIGDNPLWESWYIKEKIGEGAFGAVYRIESVKQNRVDVSALKIQIITTDGQRFTDSNKRFTYLENRKRSVENESSIMYQLKDCPNIVAYKDDIIRELYINGSFEGYYSLIRMEYLNSVYSLMRSRKFDLSEKNVIKLARDIGNGIKAAHDINIIHRDIKPENLFVSDDGIYKLGDFGIAKQAVSTRSLAGADGYIAPEVYRATTSVDNCYTNQADIYSFGICLYQMMNNGFFPLESENCSVDDAISLRLQNKPFGPPQNASPEFSRIIMKACEFNCKKRYKSINELLNDLNNIGNDNIPYINDNIKGAQTVYANDYVNEVPDKSNIKKKNANKTFSIFTIVISVIIIASVIFTIFIKTDSDESTSSAPPAEKSSTGTEVSENDDIIYGDVNGDGCIDSSDASCVMNEYSLLSTGRTPLFSEAESKAADVNGDGIVDVSDASTILSYYSYLSTTDGETVDIISFVKK